MDPSSPGLRDWAASGRLKAAAQRGEAYFKNAGAKDAAVRNMLAIMGLRRLFEGEPLRGEVRP